jgi:hypothetical protein
VTTKVNVQGLLQAQTGNGSLVVTALTKQSTYTIEGKSLANKVYLATGRGPWNMAADYKPLPNGTGSTFIRVTGIVSGCGVKTSASTNNVEVEAGVANVNGTRVVVGADATNAITRGASGKYAVTAVHVNASGTLGVTKGTDGDALDLTGGYGGAGQKPLVATTEAVLAYVVTLGDSAAVIPQGDIYAGDNANLSFRIDPMTGGVILLEALAANRTGPVERTIYAGFYDLTNAIATVGVVEEATLTINSKAPMATPNNDTLWDEFEEMPGCGWSLSVKKWREDSFWIGKVLDPRNKRFYITMKEDVDDATTYRGVGILQGDYALSMKRGAVSESLSFQGTGELKAARR